MQISVDSLASKKDLNAMLAEFLPEPDENETVPQMYQFFIEDFEVRESI